MNDLNNDENMQPSENSGENNENRNYQKADASQFKIPVPPIQQTPPVPPVNQPPIPPYMSAPGNMPPKQTDGLGIASMVLGIVSIICCWATFFGFLLGVVGLILGLCAKKSDGKKSGFAIAGIITSSIGVALGILCFIFIIARIEIYPSENYFDSWSRFEI